MMFFRKRVPKHCLIIEDPRFQPQFKTRKKSKLTWSLIACTLGLALMTLVASQLTRATTLDPHTLSLSSVNEAETGQVLFPIPGGGFEQAVHLRTTADIQISGMVARVRYKQVFKNDSDDWREAVYVFPLAENAAVNDMEMRIGDRLIRSQIKEKAEAKKIYEKAKSEGRKAALTEQQRPNLFTQKVANIAPGEEIEVRFVYLQQVGYDSGIFSFYLPTTLTPRFMPGQPLADKQIALEGLEPEKELSRNAFGWAKTYSWAEPTDQVTDAHKISPFMLSAPVNGLRNPIEINISLEAGLQLQEITSRNHKINQKKGKNDYQISLTNQQVEMDRDFWLEWTPVTSDQPEAAVFKEQIQGEDYALIMLLPPQITADKQNSLPREVIFIIDTSGSMGGASILQAKASLQLALKRLGNKDRFNIIEFNNSHSSLFYTPMAATRGNKQIASNFVHRLGAGGGTNMAPALQAALNSPSAEGFLKQVLFITDGAVGNEDALFKLIKQKLGNARLFTVGIGSAPNSHFMTRAAQFGRGTFEYISNQSEIAERMSNLFRKLESPVLSNLSVSYPKKLRGLVEQFPKRTPDLYAGEPLILSIKALDKASIKGKITISGDIAGPGEDITGWSRTLSLNDDSQHQGIAAIWARKKIAALMDEKILGRDKAEVRDEVLRVAIPHRLISAYTSFVAVEERIARDNAVPLKPGAVPNTVVKGQQIQPQTSPHSYPKTATWQSLNLILGNLSVLLLIVLYRGFLGRLSWGRSYLSKSFLRRQE